MTAPTEDEVWAPPPATRAPVLPPLPDAVPRPLVGTAAVVGVLAAGLLVTPRPGLGVPLVAGAASAVLAAVPGRRPGRAGLLLWGLALALTGVAALRASGWLVALCLLVAAVLAALAVTRARTWPALVLALPALIAYTGRAVPWAGRAAARRPRPAHLRAWLRGAGTGLAAAAVVGGLLASADPRYADLLTALAPLDPAAIAVRIVAAGAVAVAVLGTGAALGVPTRWPAPVPGRPTAQRVEWALPLALVAAVLLLWVGVQAATLFGQHDPLLTPAGDTYAARARQGFGQLVAVTLILLALLTWASRRAGAGGRRVLTALGGALVVLGLVVVASALQRMWQYDQAYGWTVLRLVVAATELWLGLVLAGSALAWLVRRTAVLAIAVPVAGAAWLLALAVAGPDALVAQWDVDRYQDTGRIDIGYLAGLSDDAVPALARLDPPMRGCVFAERAPVPLDDPWNGWNLARSRAAAVAATLPEAAQGWDVSPRWTTASPCRS